MPVQSCEDSQRNHVQGIITIMNVRLLICLSALAAAVCAPASASAAQATGSLTMMRPDAPAGTASWKVDGTMLPIRGEATVAGVPYTNDTLFNTDSRYVHANLDSADRATTVDACGDGLGGITTQSLNGVAKASSIMQLDVTLNQLTGKGSATFGLTMDPYGSIDRTFLSGQTFYHIDSNCYGSPVVGTSAVDTVGGPGPLIFNGFMAQKVLDINWPLVRSSGAWYLNGTKYVSDGIFADNTVHAKLKIAGSGVSMHATCHVPNAHDLYRATTLTAAKEIMATAGFPRLVVTAPRRTRAARRGHYYVDNMVGNENPIFCGLGYLKLTRSLGP